MSLSVCLCSKMTRFAPASRARQQIQPRSTPKGLTAPPANEIKKPLDPAPISRYYVIVIAVQSVRSTRVQLYEHDGSCQPERTVAPKPEEPIAN